MTPIIPMAGAKNHQGIGGGNGDGSGSDEEQLAPIAAICRRQRHRVRVTVLNHECEGTG